MTSEREKYLLERCLRLEVELAQARGMYIAPLLPQTERRDLRDLPPDPRPSAVLAPFPHRICRNATAAEIAKMRELRRGGLGYAAIARQVPFSSTTVRDHTLDVLCEREVGR